MSLICVGVIFLVSTPDLRSLDPKVCGTWEVVQNQIEDPTRQYAMDDPLGHNSKRSFRITVPLLCKLIHVSDPRMIYCIQLIFSLLFFRLLIKFAEQSSGSKMVNVLLPIGFSFTAIGQVGVFDVYAKFDSFALFFLLTAMVIRNPLIIFSAILLGSFTDERAFIAAPLIFLWWQLVMNGDLKVSLKRIIWVNGRAIAVMLGMSAYLLLRLYWASHYGYVSQNGSLGLSILYKQSNMHLFGVWTAFEGYWILVILALSILFVNRYFSFLLLLLTCIAPGFLVANMVMDITRSMIYVFPGLIICIQLLSRISNEKTIARLVLLSVMINILVPTYWAFESTIIFGHNPFILRLFGIFN